ncbi:hypothetical protein [Oceanisphaera sediminis]
MLNMTRFIIAISAAALAPQAAFASADQVPAKVCFSTASHFTDGVDLHQARLHGNDGAAEQCTSAQVFLNANSNFSDGVDLLQNKMAHRDAEQNRGEAGKVYLNTANNGSDGVDRFHQRMENLGW